MHLFGERQTKATLDVLDASSPPYLGSTVLWRLILRKNLYWRSESFSAFVLMWLKSSEVGMHQAIIQAASCYVDIRTPKRLEKHNHNTRRRLPTREESDYTVRRHHWVSKPLSAPEWTWYFFWTSTNFLVLTKHRLKLLFCIGLVFLLCTYSDPKSLLNHVTCHLRRLISERNFSRTLFDSAADLVFIK